MYRSAYRLGGECEYNVNLPLAFINLEGEHTGDGDDCEMGRENDGEGGRPFGNTSIKSALRDRFMHHARRIEAWTVFISYWPHNMAK